MFSCRTVTSLTQNHTCRLSEGEKDLWRSSGPIPIQIEPPLAGSTGLCPGRFWVSREKESLQLLWAVSSSAFPLIIPTFSLEGISKFAQQPGALSCEEISAIKCAKEECVVLCKGFWIADLYGLFSVEMKLIKAILFHCGKIDLIVRYLFLLKTIFCHCWKLLFEREFVSKIIHQ